MQFRSMDFDSVDDGPNDDDKGNFNRIRTVRWPYLRLYEEREARENRRYSSLQAKHRHAESNIYTVLRFFKSVEGFYTGSLDLTGRHNHRFIALQKSWTLYLSEFLPLSAHATQITIDETEDSDGESYTVTYEFTNIALWNDFQQRWKLHSNFGFGALLSRTCHVLQILSKNPVPRIQQLCLADLPTELLDAIYLRASLANGRILSSTCRRLNEVGRRHIFGSRNIILELPADVILNMGMMEGQTAYLAQLARQSREKVLSKMNFLLGNPELLIKMTRLRMADQWNTSRFSHTPTPDFRLSHVEDDFLIPIYRSFTRILSSSSNLTTIAFNNIIISLDVLHSLSQLQVLHSLELSMCPVPSEAADALLADSEVAGLSCTAYNLYVLMDEPSAWYSLLFCPSLRNLSAQTFSNEDILCPPDAVWQSSSFFPTLECLYLHVADPDEISIYAELFHSVATISPLRLMHLKLCTDLGALDFDILGLLRSLQSAPLRVLVLEGLAEAEFGLFDLISEFFPMLAGLTLVRRASNRQVENRLVTWPHASWEYASYLARFTYLQHFSWNFETLLNPPTTSPLLLFEEGFLDDSTPDDIWLEHDNAAFFGNDYWTALPFAAHCPSLQAFSVVAEPGLLLLTCRLSRAPSGAIVSQTPPSTEDPWNPWNMQRWDVSNIIGHWPPILPLSVTIDD